MGGCTSANKEPDDDNRPYSKDQGNSISNTKGKSKKKSGKKTQSQHGHQKAITNDRSNSLHSIEDTRNVIRNTDIKISVKDEWRNEPVRSPQKNQETNLKSILKHRTEFQGKGYESKKEIKTTDIALATKPGSEVPDLYYVENKGFDPGEQENSSNVQVFDITKSGTNPPDERGSNLSLDRSRNVSRNDLHNYSVSDTRVVLGSTYMKEELASEENRSNIEREQILHGDANTEGRNQLSDLDRSHSENRLNRHMEHNIPMHNNEVAFNQLPQGQNEYSINSNQEHYQQQNDVMENHQGQMKHGSENIMDYNHDNADIPSHDSSSQNINVHQTSNVNISGNMVEYHSTSTRTEWRTGKSMYGVKVMDTDTITQVKRPKFDENVKTIQFKEALDGTNANFVVALDLGYSFSGYGYVDVKYPDEIQMNQNWASHLGYTSYKLPTAMLMNSKDNLEAFGYQAYEQYGQLIDQNDSNQYKYKLQRNFKQKPQDKATWKLVSTAIQFLKTQCENAICERYNMQEIPKGRIRWVLPFPSDWESEDVMSSFRHYMHKIGMEKHSIEWFTEPDCALEYCVSTTGYDVIDGNQCVLISAGDSAVYYYVYQYSKSKGWVYIYRSKSVGGKEVNRLLMKFLGVIFGDEFTEDLEKKCPVVWYDMMNMFEMAKRDISSGVQIKVSLAFDSFHLDYTGMSLKHAIEAKVKESGPCVSLTRDGCLRFPNSTLSMLFDNVLRDIETKLGSTLQRFTSATTVFLVGGFGDCMWVKDKVKDIVGDRKLIVPIEPNLCVIKGAIAKSIAKSKIES